MKRASGKSNIAIVKDYLDGVRPFTQISMHIEESKKHRKEGEKWIDNDGIEWERKDGKNIRLTKTQGDIIREAIGAALNCKKCGLHYKWGNRYDIKFLRKTGLCYDCIIDYETKLRVLGLYNAYEKYHLGSRELGTLKELREKLKETIAYFNDTGGDIVKLAESEYDENIVWKNTNKDKILGDAIADLEKVEKLIATGEELLPKFKQEYLDGVQKHNLDFYV